MSRKEHSVRCLTCGADWSAGEWSAGCEECGGGALEIPCLVCGGRCGSTWTRAVADSNDFALGHWVGACHLPDREKRKITRERKPEGL